MIAALSLVALSALTTTSAHASDAQHALAIQNVEAMVYDRTAQQMVQSQGLGLMNVTWEDTGRNSGSAVGPNISDLTIGVRDAQGALHPMPILRFDNFTDRTADVRSDQFWLRVGNAAGDDTHAVSLKDVLKDVESYLSPGEKGSIKGSLWNARDEHVLVSAQAAFLPVPKSGEATFTPVIYNYQSYAENPAILTIVATREGTSIQIVDNGESYMSEVLYFNEKGERAPFTATRLSDFRKSGQQAHGSVSAANEDGLNTVLIAQIPLVVAPRGWDGAKGGLPLMMMDDEAAESLGRGGSDVETAVVGHGETEGPYKGLAGLQIERDTRFPVRVTVQFYQATSNGVVAPEDVKRLRQQIDRVYAEGDYVGSLVTTAPTQRPTDWRSNPGDAPVWANRNFVAY